MERKQVTSSNIMSIGYENGTLEVEFKGNRVYQYPGVPDKTVNELLKAQSVGRYFGQNIRNQFKGTKI